EHTSELQSLTNLVCRLLLEKKKCALRSEEHTSELQSLTNLVCLLLLEKHHREVSKHGHEIDSTAFISGEPRFQRQVPVRHHGLFLNDPAPPEIYPLPLHDALPI